MTKENTGTEIPINDLENGATGEAIPEEEAQELSLSAEELEALCRERVCPGCDVMQEAEDKRLRALAETENIKKRLIRESEDMKKYASESILMDMLPVLDNLDLALAHSDHLEGCKDFVMGVEMTRKAFLDAVGRHGVEAVECKPGSPFNPGIHDALGTACIEGYENDTVAQVIQNGYKLKGRILRPAKVMVNKI